MAVYETHVGLKLEMKGTLVTLTGENRKVLYDGPSVTEAKRVYDDTKAHYEQRRKAEAG